MYLFKRKINLILKNRILLQTLKPFLINVAVAAGDNATRRSFFQLSLGTPMESFEYGIPFTSLLGGDSGALFWERFLKLLWSPLMDNVH